MIRDSAFRYELREKLLPTVENPRNVTAPSPSRSSHQGLQCFKCLAKLEFLRDLFKFGKTDNSNYRSVVSSLSYPPILKCFVAFHHKFGNLPKFSQGIRHLKASLSSARVAVDLVLLAGLDGLTRGIVPKVAEAGQGQRHGVPGVRNIR